MAEKTSIKLYEKEIRTLLSLPDEQRGRILTALLAKSVGEQEPELDAMENAVYTLVYGQVERVKEVSKKRSKSVSSRYKQDTNEEAEEELEAEESTNPVQISTNGLQNPTNGYNEDTNGYTYTYTCTSTCTDTSTTSPLSSPAGEEDEVSAPTELKDQTFDQTPPDEKKSINAICECWRKYIGEPPVPLFRLARSHLKDGMEESLICKAIEISASSADKPIKYLPVVLQNWSKEGVRTLAAYEAAHPPSLPKFSGQAYGRSPSSGGRDGSYAPSYDLDEVNRLLNQEMLQKVREQGKVV